MINRQKGFSAIEAIIILVIVILLGAVGWFVFSKNKDKDNSATESSEKLETAASRSADGVNWSESPQGPYHDKISYATSTDLLRWMDARTVIAEHASVPDVMLKDGTMFLYFVDTSTDGLPEQIGLMKSTDNGKTWTERTRVSIKGENVASIIPVDPDPFLLPDGKIRLYYFDISGRSNKDKSSKNRIYSAVSSDGINFVQEDGVRFEESNIFDPDVIKVGDTWRLYVGQPEGQKVISATSKDGLNFTREGVAYEGSSVPNAFYDNDQYYLYTAGIQIATSSDGKTYKKSNFDFLSSGGVTADPGVVKLGDKSYFMIYKTSSNQAQGPPPLGQPAP